MLNYQRVSPWGPQPNITLSRTRLAQNRGLTAQPRTAPVVSAWDEPEEPDEMPRSQQFFAEIFIDLVYSYRYRYIDYRFVFIDIDYRFL
jgi:hypothetical protein